MDYGRDDIEPPNDLLHTLARCPTKLTFSYNQVVNHNKPELNARDASGYK